MESRQNIKSHIMNNNNNNNNNNNKNKVLRIKLRTYIENILRIY